MSPWPVSVNPANLTSEKPRYFISLTQKSIKLPIFALNQSSSLISNTAHSGLTHPELSKEGQTKVFTIQQRAFELHWHAEENTTG